MDAQDTSKELLNHTDIHEVTLKDKTKITIVGTAHVSHESELLVKKTIETIKPDIVCIELDENRYQALTNPEQWNKLNIFEIIKKKQTFSLIARLALSGFQKKIGQQLGTKPGNEMLAAIDSAKKLNIPFQLVDREAGITLKRAWLKTPFNRKLILLSNLFAGFFSKKQFSEKELEEIKRSDILADLLKDMKDILPEAKYVLIDERDQFISQKTLKSGSKNIVLIVGAGHIQGIKERLTNAKEQYCDIEELNSIPKASKLSKVLPWLIPVAIFTLLIYGFYTQDYEKLSQGFSVWVLTNGILGAAGAAIALAHPISIIVAFIAAPITSLNPTIGCGFVVAISEAILRKPLVEDLQNLPDDSTSLKGWYRNRLTRILLAFFWSSLGSGIGTLIATPWIIAIFR